MRTNAAKIITVQKRGLVALERASAVGARRPSVSEMVGQRSLYTAEAYRVQVDAAKELLARTILW